MIEAPSCPAIWIVTERAIRAQAALMMLIPMAACASPLRPSEQQRTMALLTGHNRMLAYQRKSRNVVIERRDLAPADFSVTLFAAPAELPLVPVILLVT